MEQSLSSAFSDADYTLFDLNKGEYPEPANAETAVVGVGFEGCEYVLENFSHNAVICTLLSAASVATLSASADHDFRAIVVDQPPGRQIHVARVIFPGLKNFGALVSDRKVVDLSVFENIQTQRFQADVPLVRQLRGVIDQNDALLAIPDSQIYSRDTSRTVLLTTYGYGKPVIGYSRAYVDAGALITSWSSPMQLLRQTAETIGSGLSDVEPGIIVPEYFSVYINNSIAKSLNLSPVVKVSPGQTFIDGEFP